MIHCFMHYLKMYFRLPIASFPLLLTAGFFLTISSRADVKLSGSVIGTPGTWCCGNFVTNVFDGNLATFFDAPEPGNGDWAGLDFGAGASNALSLVRYCPRTGQAGRMVGGVFQVANVPDFSSGVITLFGISNTPPEGVYTSRTVSTPSAYRYARYLSPNAGYGNVAEVEFYRPNNVAITLISAANSGLTNVDVRFSNPVEGASATASTNYSIAPGIAIMAATLTDSLSVRLRVSPLTLSSSYTLTVNNVRDATLASTVPTNSQAQFTAGIYGLDSRPPSGPFLDGRLPQAAPGISGNWSAVVAFTNLYFTNALGFAAVPGTSNVIVWEREGRVFSFTNLPSASTRTLVLDISNQCQGWDDSGLLNVVFHPGFATNHFIFVYYTWVTPGTVVGSPTNRPPQFLTDAYHDRLSRFTLDAAGVAVPGSELVLVDQTGTSTWHNGSGMFFHPLDGFLYVTDGDDADGSNDQIISKGLFSGIWRLDVDKRGGAISHPIPRQPAKGATANYYIPNNNPFVGQSNVLEEFYGIGLRSPHRMTYDQPSGRIFIGDVGEGTWEEVDVIEPGDPAGLNFQWNIIEGLNGDLTPPYIGVNKRPILNYSHSEGQAVIGGYVYRGSQFAADLGGKYIFGDNVQRKVWAMDESTSPPTKILLCVLPKGSGPNSGSDYTGLSSFGLDANNELYLCQMSSVGGQIYKLARTGPPPASQPFPPLLSQTGAFADLPLLSPGTNLVPYTVNAPLWSDNARKQRWISVPSGGFIHFASTGEWTFPNGTVFVKHFDLPVDDTNTNVLRRLETRFLARDTNGAVYGITYKWRTNYTDADLVTNALTENIAISTAAGYRTQQWFYPGPLDCLRCHTPAANYVLGPKTRQLNGNFDFPAPGGSDNQLRVWNHVGLFDTNLSDSLLPNYDKLVNINDTNAPLTYRVRSYLDANCAQCHRPGGAPAFWDARYDTPLPNQNIVNGTVGNTLGISGAKVVVPQDTSKSILYLRANSLDTFKMPPLARNTIDSNAVATISQWINTLSAPAISPIADITINSNSSTGPIAFTIGDANVAADSLNLSASSSNTNLVPGGNIIFGGGGSNRTITITAAPNQGGTATINLSVDDGIAATSTSFEVTVVGSLVAHYKFEGDALDSSGYGNDGVLNGGVTFVPGKVGTQALSFNGINSYVLIPRSISNDFTIAFWIKTTAVGGGAQWWAGQGLVDGEVAGSGTDFGTSLVGGKFAFGIGTPDTTILSTNPVNDGSWHHAAATRLAATGRMRVYVDGVLQSTGTGPTAPRTATASLRIGSIQSGTYFFAGTLDDVRLYNYALSSIELVGLAGNTAPMLAAISNRTILAGMTLTMTNSASDSEAPPQILTFSLVGPPPPPSGAQINSSNGIFNWRPLISQSGTNIFTVQVSDNGTPPLSMSRTFSVTVNRPSQPGISGVGLTSNQFKMQISGDFGPDYSVFGSTDLVNWLPLFTTNSPMLPFYYSDAFTTNFNQRYYRVILGP
jgi:uncharacterized repeat protein (TIGR03806 family)